MKDHHLSKSTLQEVSPSQSKGLKQREIEHQAQAHMPLSLTPQNHSQRGMALVQILETKCSKLRTWVLVQASMKLKGILLRKVLQVPW